MLFYNFFCLISGHFYVSNLFFTSFINLYNRFVLAKTYTTCLRYCNRLC